MTLSPRALNRALLQRQLLLDRADLDPKAAVAHLVAMQSQQPQAPYVGLWSRLRGFDPDAFSALLERREVVRLALLRSTVHLVTADDALALRPVLQPVVDRGFASGSPFGRRLGSVDLAEIHAVGRALVDEAPRTASELQALLGARWPDRDAEAMAHAIRTGIAAVQVPPRGLWRKGGQPRTTSAEAWLGRPLATSTDPGDLVLRYLAAFGPASARDASSWSGLVRLGPVLDRLRPQLRTTRDASGTELFDLPDAPLPDPDTPAPPRFLADFDNVLYGHADRARIYRDDRHRAVLNRERVPAVFLEDGFVAGLWRIREDGEAATLIATPFDRLADPDAVAAEGERLLAFLAPDAHPRTVEIAR